MKKQNNDALTDKAFARLVLTSILGVLACIVCLCSTTYAWFTGSVQGTNNKIQTANSCLLTVTAHQGGAEKASVDTQSTLTLECQGEYTVTLTLPKESASGYLILTVGGVDYYTDYLQRNNEVDQTLTFTLNVLSTQNVTFKARWGIFSAPCHVENNGTLEIVQ